MISSSYRRAWMAGGLLAVLGCGPVPESDESVHQPERPSIVLISIDTLRSDRLPCYGYETGETPAIDELCREGVVFERAYSHVPLTLPSHASIFTGLLPPDHGVRDNLGYRLEAEGLPNLAGMLREAGYATGAAVSAFVLRSAAGLDAGFDFYDDGAARRAGPGLGGLQRPGSETLAAALGWLETAPRPFFLFLHLFEPHAPYEPSYDGEVSAADQVVGDLVARLREMDLYDNALVILLSDHGEGLNDHGEQEHGLFLYREALQVPLVVKLPEGRCAGCSAAPPVQLIDVAPTVADVLGLEPSPRWQGTSLLRLVVGENGPREAAERGIYSETYHPRLQYGWSELRSLVRGRHHLIYGPDPELYDLDEDAAEERNVLREVPGVSRSLRALLEAREAAFTPPGESDPETRRKLAALGYVGTGSGNGPRRDPKSQLPTLYEIKEGLKSFDSRDFRAAADAFRRLAEEQPGMVKAWELLGRSLVELGERQAAIGAFEKALALSPGSSGVAVEIAFVLLEIGRLDAARDHAALALEGEPASAHEVLGRVALARKDYGEAEREGRAALAAEEKSLGALLLVAEALNRQDRPEEALRHLDRVARELERSPDLDEAPGLHRVRGGALARLGDAAAAEQEYREEIARFPSSTLAYQELAMLYALEGRPGETIATLRGMVESLASPAAYAAAVETLRILGDGRAAAALLRSARERFPESPELEELAGD